MAVGDAARSRVPGALMPARPRPLPPGRQRPPHPLGQRTALCRPPHPALRLLPHRTKPAVPLLNKLGAKEAPKTWEEFFVLADKAKAAGIQPIAWGNGQVVGVLSNQVAFGTLGAVPFKKAFIDGDEAVIRSPAMLKTFDNFRRLSNYADKSAIPQRWNCPLYTSDAAHEKKRCKSGGWRYNIKKKK